MANVTLTQTDL